jgi:hypothetical protein
VVTLNAQAIDAKVTIVQAARLIALATKFSWAVEAQWVTIVLIFILDHFGHSAVKLPFSRLGSL